MFAFFWHAILLTLHSEWLRILPAKLLADFASMTLAVPPLAWDPGQIHRKKKGSLLFRVKLSRGIEPVILLIACRLI